MEKLTTEKTFRKTQTAVERPGTKGLVKAGSRTEVAEDRKE